MATNAMIAANIIANDLNPGQISVQQSGHSVQHYDETKHVYAQDLETQEVWDFSKMDYVNRLVMNQIDGKLIEIEARNQEKT